MFYSILLQRFMADQEAWMELADLYISQQDWPKAAFCVEELMLHNPYNHLYLQRYAEIKYTHVRSTSTNVRKVRLLKILPSC